MTIVLSMLTIPPRQRATLARRIAAGLPVWAAAKGSNLPAEEVGQLMGEPEFRELVGGWADILDMEPVARKRRLLMLAGMVIEEKLEAGCGRTALFVQREYARKRDPVATLAKGFGQLVELERARAERIPPAPAAPPEPPSPAQAAVDQARTAAAMRGRPLPDDAAMWRTAGQLRHHMLGEQLLFSAASECQAAERRKVPLELHEVDAIEARQVAIFAARQAEERPKAEEASPAVPPAPPEPAAEAEAEPDAAFKARAVAMLNQTLAQAPPAIRERLSSFSQEELWALVARCWPGEDELDPAQPQGP
jgi:hypothetical protein